MKSGSRCVFEAESGAQMVERGVNLVKSSVDGGVVKWAVRAGFRGECRKRAEEPGTELNEEYADLGAGLSETIAPRAAEAFYQAFGAQLGQVVAELAEAIVVVGEPMTGQDPRMQLTGCPVSGKGTGMQQCLEHADHPVVVQLQAGHASVSDHCWFGQYRQLASVDRTSQEVSLQCQGAVIGCRQLLAQEGQILQSAPNAKMTGIVRAGFVAQDAISVLITAGVELGEGRLVVPAQHR